MKSLVIFPLLVAASLAAPVADPAVANCDNDGNIIAAAPYGLTGFAAALPAALQVPVQTRIEYQAPVQVAVPAPVETKIHFAETPVVSGYSAEIIKPALGAAPFALPAAAHFPVAHAPVAFAAAPAPAAPQVVVAEKAKFEYTVPAPAPAPVAFAPQFAYAAPQVAVAAPVETRLHYAETPVVTGYSTQVYKPAIGAAAAAFPAVAYSGFAAPSTGLAVAAPQAALNLGPQIPAGDAPAPEELVQTEKVLAPVRQVSKITPQYDVHLPAKVNVERVPYDVNVPMPYAHPVPVPVAPAIHAPVAAAYAAPAFAAHTLTVASPAAEVPCDN